METVNVLVMAPRLGTDLSFVTDVDSRVRVVDGSAAYAAELEAQGIHSLASHTHRGPVPPPQERDALLDQADVLLIAAPVLRQLTSRMPRLRWAHHTQAGVSNLWQSDLWESEITVTSSRGFVAATSIAQYVVAGALFFARGLFDATQHKRTGRIDRSNYRIDRLEDATMGVVGLGGIGMEVARLARGLGMRVVATRRSAEGRRENVEGVDLLLPPGGLEEMAGQSDFLAICAQLTAETEGMIGERVFARMKSNGVLINVSRGELVDEKALVEALEAGAIRGAVLDVFHGELEGRPPRLELMELPQVLVTSHASSAGGSLSETRELFRENLRRFLDGEPLLNVVDRSRGY